PSTVVNNPQGMVGTNFGKVINNFIHNVDEKILKRLGLEQRFGFMLLGLLFVVGLAGVYIGLKPKEKKVMTGEFRIVVARFTEDGKNLPDKIGYTIADGMKSRLDADLKEITVGPKVEIWGPDDIDQIVAGKTVQERALNAEKLAKQIH